MQVPGTDIHLVWLQERKLDEGPPALCFFLTQVAGPSWGS